MNSVTWDCLVDGDFDLDTAILNRNYCIPAVPDAEKRAPGPAGRGPDGAGFEMIVHQAQGPHGGAAEEAPALGEIEPRERPHHGVRSCRAGP
ncbi:hypothetical protein D3C72_1838570 [compost metagenome]